MIVTLWGEPVARQPAPEPDPDEAPADPVATWPDQLGLLENQPAIWDAEPEALQLALLPEPEPWEADPPGPARLPGGRGRLARRRARADAPDQLALF